MKKCNYLSSLILVCVLILVSTVPVMAEELTLQQEEIYAGKLKEIGVFVGTGDGYELDREPTRLEGLIMLVRLLGKEETAVATTSEMPFTDVPDWAYGYVAYGYEAGLTSGVSDTLFGTDDTLTATQYFTFMLRSLGYSDSEGDFYWEDAIEFMNREIDALAFATEVEYEDGFLRGDIARLSYDLLLTQLKDSDMALVDKLIKDGAIDPEVAVSIGLDSSEKYTNASSTYGFLSESPTFMINDEIIQYPVVAGNWDGSEPVEVVLTYTKGEMEQLAFVVNSLLGDGVDYTISVRDTEGNVIGTYDANSYVHYFTFGLSEITTTDFEVVLNFPAIENVYVCGLYEPVAE